MIKSAENAYNGHYHIRLFSMRVLAIVCDKTIFIPASVFKALVGLKVNDFYQSPRPIEIMPVLKLVEKYRIRDIVHSVTKFMPLEVALREMFYNKSAYLNNMDSIRETFKINSLLHELYTIARKCQTELIFKMPDDIKDLPPLYTRDGKPYVRGLPQPSPRPSTPTPPPTSTPIYHNENVTETITRVSNIHVGHVKQVLSVPIPTTFKTEPTTDNTNENFIVGENNPFKGNINGTKRQRDETDDDDTDDDIPQSKRQKINSIDAKIVIAQLESQLATALLGLQKLKQLINE
ncbi:hypothetical protein F-liban_232 [Faustovirus]|nr:hypothetical protein F-liban_232 [Faustovirus]